MGSEMCIRDSAWGWLPSFCAVPGKSYVGFSCLVRLCDMHPHGLIHLLRCYSGRTKNIRPFSSGVQRANCASGRNSAVKINQGTPLLAVYDGAYHTPLGRSSMGRYLQSWDNCGGPKRSALEIPSRRELSEDVSFGIGTLFVVWSHPGWKPTVGGGVIHTIGFGTATLVREAKKSRPP